MRLKIPLFITLFAFFFLHRLLAITYAMTVVLYSNDFSMTIGFVVSEFGLISVGMLLAVLVDGCRWVTLPLRPKSQHKIGQFSSMCP